MLEYAQYSLRASGTRHVLDYEYMLMVAMVGQQSLASKFIAVIKSVLSAEKLASLQLIGIGRSLAPPAADRQKRKDEISVLGVKKKDKKCRRSRSDPS